MGVVLRVCLVTLAACGIDVHGTLPDDSGAGIDGGEPARDGATARPDAGAPGRGPIAAYTFLEGNGARAGDVSGVEPAAPLEIENPAAGGFAWTPEGLELSGALARSGPAQKVHGACTASGAITIEAWLTPSVAAQGGPARVFTYSTGDVNQRNFTIGIGSTNSQAPASRYLVRFGTTNNVNFEIASEAQAVTTTRQHVVGTFAGGMIRVWVDGTSRAESGGGGTLQWRTDAILAVGGEPGRTDRAFRGALSYAAVFCRELDATEIAARFAAGPPR
jgi:hypothetical protein